MSRARLLERESITVFGSPLWPGHPRATEPCAVRRTTPVGPFVARLGPRVREVRRSLGWTLEEMGEQAGLHPTYISDLERGHVAPSFETVGRVAQAFGMTVAELFPDRLHRDALAVDKRRAKVGQPGPKRRQP
jgi:DNA-binding XRE family transcriptional regulator